LLALVISLSTAALHLLGLLGAATAALTGGGGRASRLALALGSALRVGGLEELDGVLLEFTHSLTHLSGLQLVPVGDLLTELLDLLTQLVGL